jgi:hypothetical protein
MKRDNICWHCGHRHKPNNAELLALLLEIKGTDMFTVHELIPHPTQVISWRGALVLQNSRLEMLTCTAQTPTR